MEQNIIFLLFIYEKTDEFIIFINDLSGKNEAVTKYLILCYSEIRLEPCVKKKDFRRVT
jgi:hypothetical protein